MEMKFRSDEAFGILNDLETLLIDSSVKYPAELIIYAKKNIDNLNVELKEYIDIRNKLIEELGKPTITGKFSIDDPKDMDEFNAKMAEYNEKEFETNIYTINVEKMNDMWFLPNEILPFAFMIV